MPLTKLAPKKCIAAPKRAHAFRLRAEGHTFEEIGHILGMSTENARLYIKKEMEAYNAEIKELAAVLRDQRLKELSKMLDFYLVLAIAGDIKAVAVVLQLMDREAKYLGMDAPTKQQIEKVTNPMEEMSIEELREKAKQRGIPYDTELQVLPSSVDRPQGTQEAQGIDGSRWMKPEGYEGDYLNGPIC